MTLNRSKRQLERDFRSRMRSSNNENNKAAHPESLSGRISNSILRLQAAELKVNCKTKDKKKLLSKLNVLRIKL